MKSESNIQINIVDLQMVESIRQLFESKADQMKNSGMKIDNETKLKLYGLFKVATVGRISENNVKSVGFFDFTEKYKNQAWEKCSELTKEQAMIEYIKLFNKLIGINDEEILKGKEEIQLDLKFDDLDIPEDYEGSFFYSSNAKQVKKEINDYLLDATETEKSFYELREKIYNGDIFSPELFIEFSNKNKFDLLNTRDSSGQTLLHVSVDGMNFSAVKSLVDLGIAEKLINSVDNFLMTPMHIAAINFDVEIFHLLSKLKPNVDMKDSEGKTCVDYLKENEDIHQEILNLIEDIKI